MDNAGASQIFLTGGSGFIGSHVSQYLRLQGWRVHAPRLDITDPQSIAHVQAQLNECGTAIHLAGLSSVADCEADPERARLVNVEGTINVFSAFTKNPAAQKFIFASTGQIYDFAANAEAYGEAASVKPAHVYGATKWAAEEELGRAAHSWDGELIILRLFNFTHKSQTPRFFLPRVYQQLTKFTADAADRERSTGTLRLGNLDLVRDMGSIQELSEAFHRTVRAVAAPGTAGVYNVGTGHGKNLRTLVVGLAEKLGVTPEITLDPSLVRSEPASIIADHSKFSDRFGWTPVSINEAALVAQFLKDFSLDSICVKH